ncbi:TPA: hypothetical protein ACNUWH_003814, partial [Aeromonas salmonicida subsp. salmonicida]
SSGRSDGVCERDKQTEHPWSACQKAPSVTVTWGWGNHDLLADLGNNAVQTLTAPHQIEAASLVANNIMSISQ